MPLRSSGSSVLRWPEPSAVEAATRAWADVARANPEVRRVGYFGSYARGDAGVGSDIDLVVIVSTSDVPFTERALAFDATGLPVPADLLVYTEAEWERLRRAPGLVRTVEREVVWLLPAAG